MIPAHHLPGRGSSHGNPYVAGEAVTRISVIPLWIETCMDGTVVLECLVPVIQFPKEKMLSLDKIIKNVQKEIS